MAIGGDTGETFRDRVAIVTGGTSGIGRATALAMARRAARVVVVARTAAGIAAVVDGAQRSAGALAGFQGDVTDERDMAAMADYTLTRFGRIDMLLACAGIGRAPGDGGVIARPVAKLTSAEWDAVVHTNLKGTFLSNRAVLPAMIAERRGDIINIASARGATYGQAFAAPYCASKFGIVGLSEALADEVAEFGVRVQVLLPDVTRTPLLERTTLTSRLEPLLSVERVADTVITMLSLPRDTQLREPVVAPQAQRLRHMVERGRNR